MSIRSTRSINNVYYLLDRSEDPEAEDVGHKWTLSALLRHLKSEGKDTSLLMQRIEDVIVKAILAAAPTIVAAARFVPHPRNCFGLSQCLGLIKDVGTRFRSKTA